MTRLMLTEQDETLRKEAARAATTGELNVRWAGENVGYAGIHKYLADHFPKTRRCDNCQSADVPTDYALIHGRDYSRDREDYLELCRSCHMHYDGGENHHKAKLTWDQVEEIRRRHVPGRRAGAGPQPNSARALAREFGVAKATINAIVSGTGWQRIAVDR